MYVHQKLKKSISASIFWVKTSQIVHMSGTATGNTVIKKKILELTLIPTLISINGQEKESKHL